MAQFSLRDLGAALDPVEAWRPRSARALARRIRWPEGWPGFGPLSLRSLDRTVAAPALRAALGTFPAGTRPRSLRQAHEHLKFPTGGGVTGLPPGPISLRRTAERILGPDVVRLRFLSQNTYLLQGLQIPLDRWVDDAVGWDALSWFGIPWGGALLLRLGLTSVAGLAIAEILALAGLTPSRVIRALTADHVDLGSLRIGAKPALEDRASEYGRALRPYDVCCLCEVWTEGVRNLLLDGLDSHAWQARSGTDGLDDWTLTGSGLLFLAQRGTIVRTEKMIFSNLGVRNRDSDAWSKKGAMLNVLDLGFGQLELFQTHLYFGGGIRDKAPAPLRVALANPSYDDRMGVWRSNLEDLAEFIRRHHQPGNVALLTGDFNMNGADVREYAEIRRVMDGLDFRDLWAWDVYDHNPSEGLTDRYTDGEDLVRDFDRQCAYVPDAATPQSCDDRVLMKFPPPPFGVGRHDFLFAERPKPAHRFDLEVSRILRRPFPRTHETDGERFLSDHLGLDATLFLRPRR